MSENAANQSLEKEVQNIKLSSFDEEKTAGRSALTGGIDIIKDIKVRLNVSVGQAMLTVENLFDLKEGQVVNLDKMTNEPVDVIVDGHVVARGTLVAVDDNFGVRITEVVERQ